MVVLTRQAVARAAPVNPAHRLFRFVSIGFATQAFIIGNPALAYSPVAKLDVDRIEALTFVEVVSTDGAIVPSLGEGAAEGQQQGPPPAPIAPPVPGAPVAPPPSTQAPATPPPNEADIVVEASGVRANDPLKGVNEASFDVTQAVDKAFFGPVALAYKNDVPEPVRDGLRNFFRNLREPVIALAFLLQLKPGKAAETLGRFAVNSTIGVVGILDIAKHRPFRLRHRANGIADTLGYYGVKPGPYFFLPLFGPTTARDFVGQLLDRLIVPTIVGGPFRKPAFALPAAALGALDRRAENATRLEQQRETSHNLYISIRDEYLKRRRTQINALHGRSNR